MLTPTCPRCPRAMVPDAEGLGCPDHGPVQPLWRAQVRDYATFVDFLGRAKGLPAYLPWPLLAGWTVADFGVVGGAATVTTVRGPTRLDGEVELTVVHERPEVGLGERCGRVEPGSTERIARRPPDIHVRAEGRSTPMWLLPEGEGELLEQATYVGEDRGNWLWLAVRPASAAMLLRDDWILSDVGGFGPQALEIPFASDGASGW